MTNSPILAETVLSSGDGHDHPRIFRVEGGLHFINGNSAPHFSLTCWAHRVGNIRRDESGGAGHEEILRHFPQFDDLAAMHLSDIHGAPMHAEANGWYFLAGWLGHGAAEYHAGNSERHFPITPPTDKPWQTTEYRKPTPDECLQIWADHIRLPIEDARVAAEAIKAKGNFPDMRKAHAAFIGAQAPRWAKEAQACIAKHGLIVYGDQWPVTA